MAENNKFKKPVLPGRDAQIEVSPELQEGIQKIGASIAQAFGRDGKKVLRTDRDGQIDIGATVRAFASAFNKTSGAIVNETTNTLKAGTAISGDIGGVKFEAQVPPQVTGQIIDGQKRAVDGLSQVVGNLGNVVTKMLGPKDASDPDAGGLPTVPTPGVKQDSMRFVNMMVNSSIGAFIFVEEMSGAKKGQHLLSSNDILDYGINMRQKNMEVGAQFAAADPALAYLALSKLQESGVFKGLEKEYAQQAMDFLKSHNDLSDLKSERMRSAQEFMGKIPATMAGVQRDVDTPATANPELQTDRRQNFDTPKR